jgi:hypothetical protein
MVLVAGCYQPSAELPCTVTCGLANACPGELTCDPMDHVCKRNGSCDPSPPDAHVQDVPDAPSDELGPFCIGRGGLLPHICLGATPTGSFGAADVVAPINTDTDARCQIVTLVAGDVCVIARDSITIPPAATLRAFGSKPLVLIGVAEITVAGIIDVSSTGNLASNLGAGRNWASCPTGTIPTTQGGGAGGSFGGSGGLGGSGDGTGTGGGLSGNPAIPTSVRGGCPGQGGDGSLSSLGGAGGGAVYLLSNQTVTVASGGGINASGAGGGGGGASAGGGGGGSGGLIAIDAATISDGGGYLMANGGGGGCGHAGSSPGAGAPTPTHGAVPAGCNNNPLEAGGAGGHDSAIPSSGRAASLGDSGGGGGGAVGVIVLDPGDPMFSDLSPDSPL